MNNYEVRFKNGEYLFTIEEDIHLDNYGDETTPAEIDVVSDTHPNDWTDKEWADMYDWAAQELRGVAGSLDLQYNMFRGTEPVDPFEHFTASELDDIERDGGFQIYEFDHFVEVYPKYKNLDSDSDSEFSWLNDSPINLRVSVLSDTHLDDWTDREWAGLNDWAQDEYTDSRGASHTYYTYNMFRSDTLYTYATRPGALG